MPTLGLANQGRLRTQAPLGYPQATGTIGAMRANLLADLASHYRSLLGDALMGLALYGSRARGDAGADSDVDVMLIAHGLPSDPFERARHVRAPSLAHGDPPISVRALTPAEYERDIAPIDLDVATDGVIFYDNSSYLADRLALIRRRIEEAGLFRNDALEWRWTRWPQRRDWRIDWDGVSL